MSLPYHKCRCGSYCHGNIDGTAGSRYGDCHSRNFLRWSMRDLWHHMNSNIVWSTVVVWKGSWPTPELNLTGFYIQQSVGRSIAVLASGIVHHDSEQDGCWRPFKWEPTSSFCNIKADRVSFAVARRAYVLCSALQQEVFQAYFQGRAGIGL